VAPLLLLPIHFHIYCHDVLIEGVAVGSVADVMQQSCKGHNENGPVCVFFLIQLWMIGDESFKEFLCQMCSADAVFKSGVCGSRGHELLSAELLYFSQSLEMGCVDE
jgi:hypothetical protein